MAARISDLGRRAAPLAHRHITDDEREVHRAYGRGANKLARIAHAQPTDSSLGRSYFLPIEPSSTAAEAPISKLLQPQAPVPPSLTGPIIWIPDPPRLVYDKVQRRYVAVPSNTGHYASPPSPPQPPPQPPHHARPPDGASGPPPSRPTSLTAPRPAAFNPGLELQPLSQPPRSLDIAELAPSKRARHSVSPTIGRILTCVTLLELLDTLLELPPVTPPGPRAAENHDKVPPDIQEEFKEVLPPVFRPATMTEKGEVWTKECGQCWEALQVKDGINVKDDWLDEQGKRGGLPPTVPITLQNYCVEENRDEHDRVVTEEVQQLLRDGRIRDVTDEPGQALHVLPLFAIRQGAKWRIVWDGRETNRHIHCDKFVMETIAEAAKIVRPGDFLFTLDMWSGYHQAALHPDLRKYCAFKWGGRIYQWCVLPFGLNVAPRTYQKVLLKLFARWRARGIRCVSYIDDGLFAASSRKEAEEVLRIVLKDLQLFGLIVNPSKAQVVPAQAVKFLGHIVDTAGESVRLYIPSDKVEKIVSEVEAVLKTTEESGRRVSGHRLASLLGKVLATRLAYAPARIATRELFACLRQLPFRLMETDEGKRTAVRDYSKSVILSEAGVKELQFLARMAAWNGTVWTEATADATLYTDGAEGGFGALMRRVEDGQEEDVVAWTQGDHLLDEEHLHSSKTELSALLRALVDLGDDVQGRCLLHRTDNVALYHAMANGGYAVGEASQLNLMVRQVWAICMLLGVRIQHEFIGGQQIITAGADLLSRERFQAQDSDRSRLKPAKYEEIISKFRVTPSVDLFAEKGGSQAGLPYFTRNAWEVGGDLLCQGYDALSQDWTEPVSYCYPPLGIADVAVSKALREVAKHGTKIVLIVPHWPARPWSALLAPYARRETMIELGAMAEVTDLPSGSRTPIGSQRTHERAPLRAYLLSPANEGG